VLPRELKNEHHSIERHPRAQPLPAIPGRKPETDGQILERLIDQWIVRTEANVSCASPSRPTADIEHGVERVRKSFNSADEYEARKKQSGLSGCAGAGNGGRAALLEQLPGFRVFRPGVQIDPKTIDDFLSESVVPRAKARGEEPPPLDAARDLIREALGAARNQ